MPAFIEGHFRGFIMLVAASRLELVMQVSVEGPNSSAVVLETGELGLEALGE